MKIYLERTNETISEEAKTVKELLKKLNINPETVLVMKNGELVTEEETLREEDKIKILSVISGG